MWKRITALLLSAVLCGVLLSACGSAPPSGETEPPADGGVAETTVRVGIAELSGCYDPFWYATAYELYVQELLFDYLIGFDASGAPVPELADWTVSDDGLRYTFTLREGLLYSDGTPVLASDFIFAMEVYADPAYDGYSDFSMVGIRGYDDYQSGGAAAISGMTAPDARTLVIELERPSLSAIYALALPAVSRAYYGADYEKGMLDGVREKAARPMGSGQYVYEGEEAGQSLTLTANPLHYRGTPHIARCVFSVTPLGMELERLILGETDLECSYPEPDYLAQAAEHDFIQSLRYPSASFGYIGLNNALPMFSDLLTRRAIACAIDRKGLTEAAYGDGARLLTAPVSRDSWANVTQGLDDYAFDLDRAAQILEQAGWSKGADGRLTRDGVPFSIRFTVDAGNTFSETLAVAMTDTLGRLGITVTTETVEFNAMYDRIYNGEVEMWFGTVGLLPDPGVTSLYHSAGYQNFGAYHNLEADSLMEAVDAASDPDTQLERYRSLWIHLNADLPAIFCYQRDEFWVAHKKLSGLRADTYNDVFRNFYQVKIEE